MFVDAWQWIKNLLMKYHPAFIIYNNWSSITQWFSDMWQKVKDLFNKAVEWFLSLGSRMYEAGKNIVSSIWDGIKSKWGEFEKWWEEKIKRIREYLPFSPAKRGPLRDIHRIQLMETIAANIKPGPLMSAMENVTGAVASGAPGMLQPVAAGGGGFSLNYSPSVSIMGGGAQAKQDFSQMLRTHKNEIQRMIDEYKTRKERVSF
jgi:phage-related protein